MLSQRGEKWGAGVNIGCSGHIGGVQANTMLGDMYVNEKDLSKARPFPLLNASTSRVVNPFNGYYDDGHYRVLSLACKHDFDFGLLTSCRPGLRSSLLHMVGRAEIAHSGPGSACPRKCQSFEVRKASHRPVGLCRRLTENNKAGTRASNIYNCYQLPCSPIR